MELKDLKKSYEILSKKYKLPSFKELNEDFDIEKIDKESEILLKVVRKVMMEKIVNALGFLEMLLNPTNAPRMYIPFLSSMTVEDKKEIDEMYDVLAKLSLSAILLETNYEEKKEASAINNIYQSWQKLKNKLESIVKKIEHPSMQQKREKNYFG